MLFYRFCRYQSFYRGYLLVAFFDFANLFYPEANCFDALNLRPSKFVKNLEFFL